MGDRRKARKYQTNENTSKMLEQLESTAPGKEHSDQATGSEDRDFSGTEAAKAEFDSKYPRGENL
jgi:hypothetical protein